MFEDIAQMEKEIETFRKNVVASSDLIEGISQLSAATRQHQESVASSSDKAIKKIESCVKQIKAENSSLLQSFEEKNEASMKRLQQDISSEKAIYLADLERINTDFQTSQDIYIDSLKQTRDKISEYQDSLGNIAEQIKADHSTALKALGERVNAAIAELQQSSETSLQAKLMEIDKIKTSMEALADQSSMKTDEQIQLLVTETERLLSEIETELAAERSDYAEKLRISEQTIKEYQAAAEQKYNEFVQRLETTNVDQIYKEVQGLKQSVKTQFMILMGSMGVVLAAVIVSIILK